jgi:hypothetical protein
MITLSEKQRQTLEAIVGYIGERGMAPTFAELRSILEIDSNQTLIDRLDSLSRKGLVTRTARQHRSISLGPKAGEYFFTPPSSPPMLNFALMGYSGSTSGMVEGLGTASGFENGGSYTLNINPLKET